MPTIPIGDRVLMGFTVSRYLSSTLAALAAACSLQSAVPESRYYPFAGRDLAAVRIITKAESISDSADLVLAWKIYGELQNSWAPGAPRPSEQTISELDALKGRLEALPKPEWFQESLSSSKPPSSSAQFPGKVGDSVFVDEADNVAYQAEKALAIVYLAEHEIDRPSAADNAGRYLTLLSLRHPWDWEVHALYARLLSDAGLADPAFHEAVLSIYLNPSPNSRDLDYFAFICAVGRRIPWDSVKAIMREAASDHEAVETAIQESGKLFGQGVQINIVPPKMPH